MPFISRLASGVISSTEKERKEKRGRGRKKASSRVRPLFYSSQLAHRGRRPSLARWRADERRKKEERGGRGEDQGRRWSRTIIPPATTFTGGMIKPPGNRKKKKKKEKKKKEGAPVIYAECRSLYSARNGSLVMITSPGSRFLGGEGEKGRKERKRKRLDHQSTALPAAST